jgi:hypothetical protein
VVVGQPMVLMTLPQVAAALAVIAHQQDYQLKQ